MRFDIVQRPSSKLILKKRSKGADRQAPLTLPDTRRIRDQEDAGSLHVSNEDACRICDRKGANVSQSRVDRSLNTARPEN